MRRVVFVVVGLAVIAIVGGWSISDDARRVRDEASATPVPPIADDTASPTSSRTSFAVPRGLRESRDDVDAGLADPDELFRVIVEVHDEFGRPVPATVVVRARDADVELARGVADAGGLAAIDVHGGPREIVLRVAADGHESVEQELVRPQADADIDQLVVLHTSDSVLLSGRVVDEHGRPLDPAVLGLVGPINEDDPAYAAMALGLGGTPRIIAYRAGAGRHADALVTELDSESGAFELELPPAFDGEVALVFDEQPLASAHWSVGTGPLLLIVPQERLERASGTLVVEVVDESDRAVSSGSIGLALDRFSFEDEPMLTQVDVDLREDGKPLVIPRVPAVQFRVTARPGEAALSGATATVNVEGGTTTRVRLVVTRGADVRLWFVPADANQSMSGPEDLRCFVASGLEVPVVVDDANSNQWRGADVRGLPPGRVAFQHDGSVLVLDLKPGANGDEHWRVVEPQAFTVRFTAPIERDADELETLRVRFELWSEDGFPALRVFAEPEWIDARDAQFVEWVAPGKYRAVLDGGVGEPLETLIDVRRSDEDVFIDLR